MKYDKRNIMKNAWNLVKKQHVSLSIALKAAWALEKAAMEAEQIGSESGWNYKVVVKDWVKGDHNRTYVSTRIYTNAWKLKRTYELGYINNMTGERIAA